MEQQIKIRTNEETVVLAALRQGAQAMIERAVELGILRGVAGAFYYKRGGDEDDEFINVTKVLVGPDETDDDPVDAALEQIGQAATQKVRLDGELNEQQVCWIAVFRGECTPEQEHEIAEHGAKRMDDGLKQLLTFLITNHL
jgi:hypothetical protein